MNRDRRVYSASYYRQNRSRILAAAAARRAANPDLSRNYYLTHSDEQRRSGKERRALLHAFVDAAVAGGCVDCGIKHQDVLDLDHVRGPKIGNVREMAGAGVPLARLLTEIDKGETRCASCHRRATAIRRREKLAA